MSPRYLPVSPEERESWKIGVETPKFPKFSTDTVSFVARKDGNRTSSGTNAACYAGLGRGNLGNYEILCRPLHNPGAISLEDTHLFFQSLTQVGILPEGIKIWEQEDSGKEDCPAGIYCQVPALPKNSKFSYTALCCYRWLDSDPRIVWKYCRYLEQPVKRHPLQVLVYLVGNNNRPGHSFLYEGIKRFPCLGPALRKVMEEEKDHTSLVTSVTQATTDLTHLETIEGRYGKKKVSAFALRSREEYLHSSLAELYYLPEITQEKLREVQERIFTEDK